MRRLEAGRLRRELEVQSRRRERRRYPEGLRGQAVEYGRGRRKAGASDTETAAELGLRVATLQTWMRQAPAFRRVEVIAEAPASPAGPERGIVVTTSRGLRIEGLAIDDVVILIARVG